MHKLPSALDSAKAPVPPEYGFEAKLADAGLDLRPVSVETLQLNVTRLCNQACRHCHVNASPKRTEMMDRRTWERCLEVLEGHESILNLDITGGAPELHPDFEEIVVRARKMGKKVIVRHNLTVTFDGNPQTGRDMSHLPDFFADNGVEVVSSLPYYQVFFTDRQRGKGVFDKSIEGIRRLNERGYGKPDSGLMLHLVYNPAGAFLPASQQSLERDFRRELSQRLGLVFNHLFTIANMPIHRFRQQLERSGGYHDYMVKLVDGFNPEAAEAVMCRFMLSVGYDGRLFDCDFNQMLEIGLRAPAPQTIFDFQEAEMLDRGIRFEDHCFGCTAGCGSSCGGATADD